MLGVTERFFNFTDRIHLAKTVELSRSSIGGRRRGQEALCRAERGAAFLVPTTGKVVHRPEPRASAHDHRSLFAGR